MTFTAARHQEQIEVFWPHFWGVFTLSIFVKSVVVPLSRRGMKGMIGGSSLETVSR